MRFCYFFGLTASSPDARQTLARHRRFVSGSRIPCGQAHLFVYSRRSIFLRPITRPTWCPQNLTEFPFAHNFSMPDLEVL